MIGLGENKPKGRLDSPQALLNDQKILQLNRRKES